MSTVHLGRGSIVVEFPERELMAGLSIFRHGRDGKGEYEELFNFNSSHNTLVTMPGFAERVVKLCPNHRVKDERVPLPSPDLEAATGGIDEVWCKVVCGAVKSGGGVVSIPDILGAVTLSAAILRAYPRDKMLYRGTPVSIIATRDGETAKSLGPALRELLPEREVGVGKLTDSDDVIVVPYSALDQVPRHMAGIFIGTDALSDTARRLEFVSGFRNAARWGVVSTAGGGEVDVDMTAEGLFGPLAVHTSYADAVKAKVAVQVTVCWLPCPRPMAPQVSADEKMMEYITILDNPQFLKALTDIMKQTSGDRGCFMVGSIEVVRRMGVLMPETPQLNRSMIKEDRKALMSDIASGVVRKALVAHGYYPPACDVDVMVAATLGGAEMAGAWFPWRRPKKDGDKVYVVDFSHEWDVHNGRPGRLARNDEARKCRYAEMGCAQICVGDINQLPFL